ncbi:MAG: hypothetical protein QXD03_02155 [Candidatus Anstonellales archaeon]
MIIGPNLSAIPFVSSTDSTRLQMSSKQLPQSVTSLNCEIPKVLSDNWEYLSFAPMFRRVAEYDGEVLYSNDDFIIVMFRDGDRDFIEVIDAPVIKNIYSYYAISIRNRLSGGDEFREGDMIYEYDSFIEGIPSFGYNLFTCYLPWFGFNHEDAVVISESAADRMVSLKTEDIVIPIYENSVFDAIFSNSKYKIFPDIGFRLDSSGVLGRRLIFSKKACSDNIIKSAIKKDDIVTRLNNGIVYDVSITKTRKDARLVHDSMNEIFDRMYRDYVSRIYEYYKPISEVLGDEFARRIMIEKYLEPKYPDSIKDIYYLVRITVAREDKLELGDKITTRYANKGVISLIMPDELMPYSVNSKRRSDIIIGPISILSRMIIGQILENIISKFVFRIEDLIKENRNNRNIVSGLVRDISHLTEIMGMKEYSSKIFDLSKSIVSDNMLYDVFISSIDRIGLYIEAPSFSNFKIKNLVNFINSKYPECNIMEPVIINEKSLKYMLKKLRISDVPINGDIVLDNVFCSYNYVMRLKHDSSGKITARDFGDYTKDGRPMKGHHKKGQSSKLGHMEISSLLSAGLDTVVEEIYKVKSDVPRQRKVDLITSIMIDGYYRMSRYPDNTKSYSKMTIDSLINFILSS